MYSEIASASEERSSASLNSFRFRTANTDDLEFIIEAIIESEKSGAELIGTCLIFGISEEEYKNILAEVLMEDVGDYEYSFKGFLIAESNDEYLGTSGSWIEKLDGVSSGIMKTSILTPYLSEQKIGEMRSNMNIINALTIPREPFAFQLEHIYIRKNFRNRGLFSILIKENIKRNLTRYPFNKVQTILFDKNLASFYAHLKFGFEVIEKKAAADKEVLKYFPFDSKVLMELNKEKINRL